MINMDALYDAVAARGPVCVGLDTAIKYIPECELARADTSLAALFEFNRAIIDATLDVCACYKVQIAYYEALGLAGLKVYAETLRYARGRGALVIADIKRGDIADTASRYAVAHFAGDFEADFVTLSPYMGMDSIEPWLDQVRNRGKGAFVLMRTSNPGRHDFQERMLADGGTLHDAVGDRLDELADRYRGVRGYGAIGAVVGCTEADEAASIRERRSGLFFLIPGYGAQGGGAAEAALLLRGGNGGIVNASRSILRAWTERATSQEATFTVVAESARDTVTTMREAIGAACAAGGH
jgi:orotidine-5'-phosphate decarboxylase